MSKNEVNCSRHCDDCEWCALNLDCNNCDGICKKDNIEG